MINTDGSVTSHVVHVCQLYTRVSRWYVEAKFLSTSTHDLWHSNHQVSCIFAKLESGPIVVGVHSAGRVACHTLGADDSPVLVQAACASGAVLVGSSSKTHLLVYLRCLACCSSIGAPHYDPYPLNPLQPPSSFSYSKFCPLPDHGWLGAREIEAHAGILHAILQPLLHWPNIL